MLIFPRGGSFCNLCFQSNSQEGFKTFCEYVKARSRLSTAEKTKVGYLYSKHFYIQERRISSDPVSLILVYP